MRSEIVTGSQQIHRLGDDPPSKFVSAVRKDGKKVYLLEVPEGGVISPNLKQWHDVYRTALSFLENRFFEEMRGQLRSEGVSNEDLEHEYPHFIYALKRKERHQGNGLLKGFLEQHDIVQLGPLESGILKDLRLNPETEAVVFWMRGILFQFTNEGDRFTRLGGKIEK